MLKTELITLEARLSLMTVGRLIDSIKDRSCTYEDVKSYVTSLNQRLADELSLVRLFVIDERRAEFYEPKSPHFGHTVSDKFPSASNDIEEAGKRLAVRRSTACVTHLMRAIEPGLNSLVTAVEVSFDRANWNTILDQIDSAVKSIGGGPGPHPANWQADKQFYSEAAVHLR